MNKIGDILHNYCITHDCEECILKCMCRWGNDEAMGVPCSWNIQERSKVSKEFEDYKNE